MWAGGRYFSLAASIWFSGPRGVEYNMNPKPTLSWKPLSASESLCLILSLEEVLVSLLCIEIEADTSILSNRRLRDEFGNFLVITLIFVVEGFQ